MCDTKVKQLTAKERYGWKQPTPGMQLIAVVSSLQGHFSNYMNGITDSDEMRNDFTWHLQQLFELGEIMYNEKWPLTSDGS